MDIIQQYAKEGIFLALYIWTIFKNDKDKQKQDATNQEREKQLQGQLEKSNEQLTHSIEVIQQFDANFKILNDKIDRLADKG